MLRSRQLTPSTSGWQAGATHMPQMKLLLYSVLALEQQRVPGLVLPRLALSGAQLREDAAAHGAVGVSRTLSSNAGACTFAAGHPLTRSNAGSWPGPAQPSCRSSQRCTPTSWRMRRR